MPTPLPDLMDSCRRIFLRGYEVQANIGIHDFEKAAPQRIVVNVDLYVALEASSPQKDELAEVVDYDFIRDVVARRIAEGHIGLQETLCDSILDAVLVPPAVVAACVSTEKPDVYPDCRAVGVEVCRRKLR